MKFGDLEISNFLAIGEATVSLLDIGLASIAGESDETSSDSNGAGKSSIGDALCWCLWGTTARDVGGDEVVNTAIGKGTRVSVPVIDEDVTYRITRARKHPKLKNGLQLFRVEDDGSETDLTKGTTKATQAAIERVLGCSEDVFRAAVYSGQEQMPDIPRMTDKQLKLLVEQAAGVDVLANAYEIAKGKARITASNMADAQIAFDRAVERHGDMVVQITRTTDSVTQWETAQAAKIVQLRQATIDGKTDFETAQADLDPAGEKDLLDTITECQGKIAAVAAERTRETVLIADVAAATTAVHTLQRKIDTETATVASATAAVAARQRDLDNAKAGIGKPCGECARPMGAEHLKVSISAAEARLEAETSRLAQCQTALDSASTRLPSFKKALKATEKTLTDHQASMTDVSAESARLQNLQREVQIIEAGKREVERLRQLARAAGENWKREAAAENPYKAILTQQNDELIARAKTVEERKAEGKVALEADRYAQTVAEVFAPAGVRAHRLDEATPYLNDRTAHYLGSLADGTIEAFWTTLTETKGKGELREKFSVTVEKAGSAPTFNNLSGGEKRKVRLACALALQDLVATRASKSIDLMLLDEIDDALDAAGLERLMSVLEEKARARGTVLIISHNDVADYCRKTILVEKKNGIASVTAQ